ncbi:hypothetical protein BG004_001847 [Podila humilis]|nr:hypothetical protein BG004_001847 [Podila humilis]
MSLTKDSIECILTYLEPFLDTLETGFPTSSRPNEPKLTSAQKRDKMSLTLTTNPGIFLTRWGSVILYPRPVHAVDSPSKSSVQAHSLKTPLEILELFTPLQADYEVKYQLSQLYQQLHRVNEHHQFEARRRGSIQLPAPTFATAAQHQQPMELKPTPGQNDLFSRTALSQNTRRNRRLNYLLRHLAPPGADNPSASRSPPGVTNTPTSSNSRHSHPQHPTLATILSISGSMSNLSFSESTYFSDAEMEARAPELYRQYIGRFMDQDDDEAEDGEAEDGEDELDKTDKNGGGSGRDMRNNVQGFEADDEREDSYAEPFGEDVGLVDRILWNIDNPSKRLQKRARQDALDKRNQYQEGHNVNVPQNRRQEASSPLIVHVRRPPEHTVKEEEEEFEEEFDTESEGEDETMKDYSTTDSSQLKEQEPHPRGPLMSVADDEIREKTSVTPRIPPEPQRSDLLSSTMASAAFTMEQPEERAIFAQVANGNDDSEQNEDDYTEQRKEDQEALRREFVLLMKQRFLDGLDTNFDYSTVDFDEELDDLEQEGHDEEDRYFDAEDDEDEEDITPLDQDEDVRSMGVEMNGSGQVAGRPSSRKPTRQGNRHGIHPHMTYDERLSSWENRPQNGSGEYDY